MGLIRVPFDSPAYFNFSYVASFVIKQSAYAVSFTKSENSSATGEVSMIDCFSEYAYHS